MEVILRDFHQKISQEDIVIRFYEDFLAAYKPQMRERRGVYYTPEPVVSYMVRSVDELLKDKFNKPLGIADPEVTILDPACGTGTFLLWIFQLIHKRFQESPEALTEGLEDKSWSGYVRESLLPRVFGFELLMAPYAIAHLKLGLFLQETGYQFDGGKRLEVYLTNSLEQAAPDKPELPFEEFIAQEGEAALEIKRNKPIMVIIGNPPYSPSIFEGEWIMNLIQDYKEGLNKQKSDLNREEWKFIRFAHQKIGEAGQGITAFVVNNTFLDANTHRIMRKSLLNSFQNTYVLDLHGSTDKREKTLEGLPDKNVFDIKQGVAILLATKTVNNEFKSRNFYEIYADRNTKYNYLLRNDIKTTEWKFTFPEKTQYLFLNFRNFDLDSEYKLYHNISDIYFLSASGVQTKRDNLVTDLCYKDLDSRLSEILDPNIREKYQIEDSSGWSLSKARKSKFNAEKIKEYNIKPFDWRFVYYDKNVLGRDRYKDIRHILEDNMGLVLMKQVSLQQEYYSQFFVSQYLIAGRVLYSNRGTPYIFPLYLYPEKGLVLEEQRRPNLSPEFLNAITSKLGYTPTPEAIFYYIYAIFHSPTYPTRYAEFLKIDFPCVPLTSNDELFRQLSEHGEQLVQLHLMTSPKLDNLITKFVEETGDRIVAPRHPKNSNGAVIINKKGDKFTGIPEEVWNFYIGGYQPCQKWLKDRKGRTLSDEDILHYQKIVVALKETIEIMKKIDKSIPSFPIK